MNLIALEGMGNIKIPTWISLKKILNSFWIIMLHIVARLELVLDEVMKNNFFFELKFCLATST